MARVIVLGALLAASACLITSAPPEGAWSPLTRPCVPVGAAPRLLASGPAIQHFAIGGDTVVYGFGDGVRQVHVTGGEPATVTRAYGDGPLGVFGDDLVYVVPDVERGGVQVVLDRGIDATDRWQTLGRAQSSILNLLVIPAGVYWARDPGRLDWRWSPDKGAVPFNLVTGGLIATDGTDLLFRLGDGLWMLPVTGGSRRHVIQIVTARPVAIDAAAFYYARTEPSQEFPVRLIAHARDDRTERVLVTFSASGIEGPAAVGGGYLYFVDDAKLTQLRRVPIAGGPVEVVFRGEPGIAVWGPAADDCNVYWTMQGPTNSIYARSH